MAGMLFRTLVNQIWYWSIGYRINDTNGYDRIQDAIHWYKARRNCKS